MRLKWCGVASAVIGKPVGLGPTHQLDAPRGRQVQEVHRHPGEPHQFDVAVQHQLLGDRRPSRQAEATAAVALVHHRARREPLDLAVLRQRDAEPVGVLERSTHQQRILHAVAVVGEQPARPASASSANGVSVSPARPTVIDPDGSTSHNPARSP